MLLVGSFDLKGKENPYRKPVSEMTYNVFGVTLNTAQPNPQPILLIAVILLGRGTTDKLRSAEIRSFCMCCIKAGE